ncbi:MAG: hypothetical protein HYY13_05040 [Nitrospirae bacterium]|nr:hypothetical protein [Nitrospirota bacterium]
MKRKLAIGAGLVLFTIGALAAKVYIEGRVEFRKAKTADEAAQAVARGEGADAREAWLVAWEEAVARYERAARWYVPGARHVGVSLGRLWEIGEMLEGAGEPRTARQVYERLRSSIYAIRSTYTPHAEWLDRCDRKIAALMASEPPFGEDESRKSFEEREREHYELLKRDYTPGVFWSIVIEIGFWGWIGCLVGFFWHALGEDGRWIGRRALAWLGGIVVSYGVWVLGLIKA